MEQIETIVCPVCVSRVVGKLGNSQYYCWDCCVQFSLTDRGVETFHIGEDGALIAAWSDESEAEDRPAEAGRLIAGQPAGAAESANPQSKGGLLR